MSSTPDPRASLSTRVRGLAIDTLQWVLGLFCGFVGALILVAPHQFARYPFAGFQSHLAWRGVLILATGVGLLAVAMARPRRFVVATAHAAAGLTLLTLAAGFAGGGAWTGVIVYTVLGLGTGLAAFLPAARRPGSGTGGDLFSLSIGLAGIVSGAAHLVWPALLQNPYFDASRPYLPLLATSLLVGGAVLVWAQLERPLPAAALGVAHLLGGGAFVLYGVLVSISGRTWTGVALYCGCCGVVALLPWLRRRLAVVDPYALRTQLAFVFALATAVALILTVAVVTTQEEHLETVQITETQEFEARTIARNVADYIDLNGARTAALAAVAGNLPLAPAAQQRLLAGALTSYPDVTAFSMFDLAGEEVATTGGVPLDPGSVRGIVAATRDDPRVIGLDLPRVEGRSLLLLSAAVAGPRGGLGGVLVTALDSVSLRRRIARPGSKVYLADGKGRLIAVEDGTDMATAAAVDATTALPEGWNVEVAPEPRGRPGGRLAAFARVPDVGWVVAVERSRGAALAGVRRGRDLAFLLLLLVVVLSALGGIVAARRIARPLGSLSAAVGQLTAGNSMAPLPASDISEVAHLAAAFREMRDRLAARTRESERLAAELRARAEALADSDRRKDEFLAMLAHELRNPLGAISNAGYLLGQSAQSTPVAVRAVAIVQRQTRHLVRMVDDLLDVSRITRGKVELKREPVELTQVVQQVVETVRPLLDERRHEVAVRLPGRPLVIDADATRLEQVLANLLRNAAKYTEPGGRITVALEAAEAGEQGEAGRPAAVMRVADTGIGIAPDLLPRVFDLFTQGEQGLDRSEAGLGIGLTLVRHLVEMHGGRVEARSEGLGRGSEFVVWLPLAGAEPGPRASAPLPTESGTASRHR